MRYAQKLAKLIQMETVSGAEDRDLSKFMAFHTLLRSSFPALFSVCEYEQIEGAVVLRWPGRGKREPILFMNHFDVVEATGNWEHPPFSGEICDGALWGRGTVDTKGGLFCMLQAAQELAESGFVPEGDIYFESSCTEETTGASALAVSLEFMKRKLHFAMILDEGGLILYDPIGGADATFAMIGVGEKGCMEFKLVARSEGGHAARPGKNTPLVRLGKLMAEADKNRLFPVKISEVTREMFRRMAPYMSGPAKLMLRHPTVFDGLLRIILPALSATSASLVRTTLAFTMAHGSEGRNVLPSEAWVVGNMRFSHHQGKKNSMQAVEKLARKYRASVEILDNGVESPLCSYDTDAFRLIERGVSRFFPDVVTAPYVTTTASDARYFGGLTENCLRFVPFTVSDQQLDSIHGLNENVSLSALPKAVDFYRFIMQEA